MRNGWRCSKARLAATAATAGGIVALSWMAYQWWLAPRTPEGLFRTRCSACHELRHERLCELAPEQRPAVVDTMRRMHGADAVIDEEEARLISGYLTEDLPCP